MAKCQETRVFDPGADVGSAMFENITCQNQGPGKVEASNTTDFFQYVFLFELLTLERQLI